VGHLGEVVGLLRPLAQPGVVIELDVPPSLPQVLADPKRLRQIVWNLSGNAVKFTTRGRVTLRAASSTDRLVLTVEDTGPGIPRAQLEAIFEDFVQVEGSGAASQGSGLGLSIVKRLVALHGGRIEVDSEQGRGSRFDVSLPLESGT
jgi:signal transduction histidine kinase